MGLLSVLVTMIRGRFGSTFVLILGALLFCSLLGCRDTQEKPSSTDVDITSKVLAPAADSMATSDAPKRDPQPVVPGTVVAVTADDPASDGWQSELFAARAGTQLKALMRFLPGYDEQRSTELTSLASDSVRCQPMRPSDLNVVYETPAIIVKRMATTANVPSLSSDLEVRLRDLLSGVNSPHDVHSKIKVFRVNQGATEANATETTSSYIQIWGKCDGGTFQINTTWRCVWEQPDSALPRLTEVEILDFEEVVASGIMFSDCTEAVLTDPSFREQLLPGVDHWLGTIESRMGIDVGGWQGLAIADVNGDGLDDLYCCQPGGLPNRLYLQQSDGTCSEESAAAGMDWLDSSHAALFVDLDNDGDQDAVVGLDDGVLILANNGQGHFSIRAERILPAALPYSLSAADFDSDGDLDIYICCYNRRRGVNQHLLFARPVPYHDANNGGRNVLLRNDITSGGSTWQFRYVTKQVGLDENNRRFSYASAWEDYDDDGDLDLYVANDFGRNNLFRNDGGRFVDVAPQARVEDISPGMSVCWGDYDNDGLVDLYVSNMFSSAGNRIAFQDRFHSLADAGTRATFQRHARGNTLFQNTGDGMFRDVSEDANVVLGRWAWGSRFADLNGDGWQDLVVANGFITQQDTGDL